MTETPGKVRWTNLEYAMNRAVLLSLIAGLTWGDSASAYESYYLTSDLAIEQWQGGHFEQNATDQTYKEEWQGAGIGSITGALLAGPPGFIIGAVGGVLAGRNSGMESDLHTTRQEVELLKRQQKIDAEKMVRLQKRLAVVQFDNQQQLQAIASGFLYRIQFRSNQSALEAHDQLALQALSQALATLHTLKVHIHAFADRRGRKDQNQALSEARASAVKDQLTASGVAAERIELRSYGEANAHYPQSDTEGLGYDRQVVVRFHLKENS
ncbi:MAG: OmpA family protein [Sedimenticola sp.]|nr:OmpA family protein [Sedimenticola sp.]MCW8921906.1 OmpA family protein [Sedimenticola sp.]